MMTRYLRPALLFGLLVATVAGLAACSTQKGPELVTLTVLGKRNAPTDATWVAYDDGSGAWHPLRSSRPGTYQVRPDSLGRYSVAVGCASDPPNVTVFSGTVGDTMTLSAKCELADDEGCEGEAVALTDTPTRFSTARDAVLEPLAGAVLFTIEVEGLPTDQSQKAFTYFHGDPLAIDASMGDVYVSMGRDNVLFFTLIGPASASAPGRPDPNAVSAWSWTTASSAEPAIHVVASGESSNVSAPTHGNATVTGDDGDAVSVRATLKLPHAVRVPLGTASGTSMEYHLVPAELASQSEEASTMLAATALGADDAVNGRSVRSVQRVLALGAPAVETLALPLTPLASATWAPDGTARWQPYGDAQRGPAQAYQLTATVGPQAAPTLQWRAAFTPAWLAESGNRGGTLLYRLPELAGVAGSEWLIPEGASGSWQLDALVGKLADGQSMDLAALLRGHDAETPGLTIWSAGRSGPL